MQQKSTEKKTKARMLFGAWLLARSFSRGSLESASGARTTPRFGRLGKRGTSLVEMAIVLLILAMVSLMVTSFSSLVNNQVMLNVARNDTAKNLTDIREALTDFVTYYDQSGYTFSVSSNRLTATPTSGTARVFMFDSSKLLITAGYAAGNRYVTANRITGLTFKVELTNSGTGCKLISCTVRYRLAPSAGKDSAITSEKILISTRRIAT